MFDNPTAIYTGTQDFANWQVGPSTAPQPLIIPFGSGGTTFQVVVPGLYSVSWSITGELTNGPDQITVQMFQNGITSVVGSAAHTIVGTNAATPIVLSSPSFLVNLAAGDLLRLNLLIANTTTVTLDTISGNVSAHVTFTRVA
jgi:hypothetical protein